MLRRVLLFVAVVFLAILPDGVCSQEDNLESQKEVANFHAQEEFFEARVLEVLDEREIDAGDGSKTTLQELKLEALDGSRRGEELVFKGVSGSVTTKDRYRRGDRVLVSYAEGVEGGPELYVVDYVRRGSLFYLAALFALVIAVCGRWKGLRAIAGLAFSFLVILYFIIPAILGGANPLAVTLAYCAAIVVGSTYLVYGFGKKSNIAIAGTFSGVLIVGILSFIFGKLVKLAGFAQEEAVFLLGLTRGNINLEGLLLAGFVVGALGVLGDIAISQVSTVEQLQRANAALSRTELYKRAMKVGVDHIASMVNTLFLAYAGAAFPLLLLFSFKQEPFSSFARVVSSEVVATEIVRMLVGSIGLALAVPITTLLAAHLYSLAKSK